MIDAVRHAQRAQGWSYAAGLLAEQYFSLFLNGQDGTVGALLADFPASAVSDPELAVIFALTQLSRGSLDEVPHSSTTQIYATALEKWGNLPRYLRTEVHVATKLERDIAEVAQPLAAMKWFFEPGHTAAEFRARHMMVTWVRGSFKDVHGTLEFNPDDPAGMKIEAIIDARTCWTGEAARDAHLRSNDFFACESYPEIRFASTAVEAVGAFDYRVTGDLTIRNVTRPVVLNVHFLGVWQTSWWEDGVDKGPRTRAGFTAKTQIDRYDFGVNWNDALPGGGVVVSRAVDIVLDAEAILEA